MATLTFLQRVAITLDHRREWYRALSKTAAAGLPQVEVLQRMSKDFTAVKHPMGPLVNEVLRRLQGGHRAGPVVNRRTVGSELRGMVPQTESLLIHAGITSGKPVEGFENAAKIAATQTALRGAIMDGVSKPLFYVALICALLLFLSIKLLPAFAIGRPRVEWPSSAQTLGLIADNTFFIVGGVTGLLVVSSIFLTQFAPRWVGPSREWCDRHIFPFGLMSAITGSSFLTALSAYLSAGIPIVEGVQNIAQSTSPYLKYHCNRLLVRLKDGVPFADALVQMPIIHTRFHWLIGVYGLSSDAASAYAQISDEMVRGVLAYIQMLFGRIIGNILLILVAGMVMWIYSSMFAIATPQQKLAVLPKPYLALTAHRVSPCVFLSFT